MTNPVLPRITSAIIKALENGEHVTDSVMKVEHAENAMRATSSLVCWYNIVDALYIAGQTSHQNAQMLTIVANDLADDMMQHHDVPQHVQNCWAAYRALPESSYAAE